MYTSGFNSTMEVWEQLGLKRHERAELAEASVRLLSSMLIELSRVHPIFQCSGYVLATLLDLNRLT